MATLIGYRKVKSFVVSGRGISDVELGSFSIWKLMCFMDTGMTYQVWLDLESIPDKLYEINGTCEAKTEEDAKQIVLDHIGDSSVSRLWIPHAGAFMSYTGAFSKLLPLHQSELLHLMEIRA